MLSYRSQIVIIYITPSCVLLFAGHCELARRTGATIYFGPGAASRTQFTIHELKDGEVCDKVCSESCGYSCNVRGTTGVSQ